jgi:hypothetical protein
MDKAFNAEPFRVNRKNGGTIGAEMHCGGCLKKFIWFIMLNIHKNFNENFEIAVDNFKEQVKKDRLCYSQTIEK